MHEAPGDLENTCVHLDDTLVASHSEEQQSTQLRDLFDSFSKRDLAINISKCELRKLSVTFLEHITSPSGLDPKPDKVITIRDHPESHTYQELWQFINLVNFCKHFIPNCAEKIAT